MKEKEINQYIKDGIHEIAPDCLETIMDKISQQELEKSTYNNIKPYKQKKIATCLPAIAACIILIASIYGGYYQGSNRINTIVELDVNPSIEFQVNQWGNVKKVVPLNKDGAAILSKLSSQSGKLEKVTLYVIDELVSSGYITKDACTVLLSVENQNQKKAKEIQEELSGTIQQHSREQKIPVLVVKQTIVRDDSLENLAEEYDISVGKAMLVRSMVENHQELSEASLARMTVDEIAQQAETAHINLEGEIDQKADTKRKDENAITRKAEKTIADKEITRLPQNTQSPEKISENEKGKKEDNEKDGKDKQIPNTNQKTQISPTNKPEKTPTAPGKEKESGDKKSHKKLQEEPVKKTGEKGKEVPSKTPDREDKNKPTQQPQEVNQPTPNPANREENVTETSDREKQDDTRQENHRRGQQQERADPQWKQHGETEKQPQGERKREEEPGKEKKH